VPVACSNTSATGEIAGDAALLFDPRDIGQIADALARLLAGGTEIERLRRAGFARAAEFTWERTARGLLASYAAALASR
jgi:glycosyltransferase involved in cell wall biosynthesis